MITSKDLLHLDKVKFYLDWYNFEKIDYAAILYCSSTKHLFTVDSSDLTLVKSTFPNYKILFSKSSDIKTNLSLKDILNEINSCI